MSEPAGQHCTHAYDGYRLDAAWLMEFSIWYVIGVDTMIMVVQGLPLTMMAHGLLT